MHPLIARRSVAYACGGVVVLYAGCTCERHTRAQTVAIASGRHQVQSPISTAAGAVHQQFRFVIQTVNDDVDSAVVVNVSERCTAVRRTRA